MMETHKKREKEIHFRQTGRRTERERDEGKGRGEKDLEKQKEELSRGE